MTESDRTTRTLNASSGTRAAGDPVAARMRAAATLSGRLGKRLPDDPGLSALRRAARAALIIPATFAFAKFVIGDIQTTTFAVFGCFALLVMSDFGGSRRPRAAAYLIATLVGAAMVLLGTLASPVPWVAVAAMLLVGFSIQFVGVFGGYVAAAQTALLLAFVLSVTVAAPLSAVGSRLVGWLMAGLVSTLAGVFIWPHFERLALRTRAAEACRALAELVRARHPAREDREFAHVREVAQEAVEAVRRQYRLTPKRPAGPSRRDRAFVELLTEVERSRDFMMRPFRLHSSSLHPCTAEGNELADAVVRTLEGSADVLVGDAPQLESAEAAYLLTLNETRLAHRRALDRWAADALRAGTSPQDVLAGLDADHTLRVISYLALAIGSNAVIAAGGRLGEELQLPAGTPREGRTRPLLRIARTIRTHLTLTSSVLHHSLRVGIGLALAVLLARMLGLSHAFWVVLGTLSVLRSNAFGTGRTTLEALVGTVAGFAVGALFTIATGSTSGALWIALPPAVFLATYAAGAIGFMVGQAAFTVLVIILFNLISPVGWRVGLARIEDVAVGVAVSVVAGLLLWPRGARGEMVTAVAGLYRSVAALLASSFAHILDRGSPEDAMRDRRRAVEARDRAGEAFELFLYERGIKPLDPETAAFLVAAGTNAILVGDLLNVVADMGYQAEDSLDGIAALRVQTQLMLADWLRLADRLEGTTSAFLSRTNVSNDTVRAAILSALRRWRDDPAQGRSAMATVIAGEWTQQLGDLVAELEAPAAQAAEETRIPWWR